MHVCTADIRAYAGIVAFKETFGGLNLICGDNSVGKTSVIEALRYAMLGTMSRATAKGDYPLLVTEGSTKCRIAVEYEDGPQRDRETVVATLPTGKHISPIDPKRAEALALDPTQFMRLSDDERRTLLYTLAGPQDDVLSLTRARLVEAGATESMLQVLMPLVTIGFPDAHREASSRLSACRTAWRTITGEAYGSNKAEGWVPSTPIAAPLGEELHDARQELAAAKEALVAAAKAVGALPASMDPDTRVALQAQANSIERIEANIADGEQHLAKLKAKHLELTERAAANVGICFDCPCCGKPLRYAGGAATERVGDPADAVSAGEALNASLPELASTETKLATLRGRLANAREAQARLDAAGNDGDAEADEAARVALSDAQAREADASKAVETLEQRMRHKAELVEKANKAGLEHENAKRWTAAIAVLAPDGLPQELLGWALTPVNERLRDGPAGWPVVQLRGDMMPTIGGRPYGLCSRSEQWRADVLIAAWIAERAGTGLVFADEMDLLSPASRGPFLRWAAERSEAGTHQFFVAATLHSPPAIDFASVFWLGSKTA